MAEPNIQRAMDELAALFGARQGGKTTAARCVQEIYDGAIAEGRRQADADRDGSYARGVDRGFAEAVGALRDDARYDQWWSALPQDHPDYGYWSQQPRRQFADYLETVGPWEPAGQPKAQPEDVEVLESRSAGWVFRCHRCDITSSGLDQAGAQQRADDHVALGHTEQPEPAHPEAKCHLCAGPNIAWSAPSPLWNAVMRGGSINGDEIHDGIVCPVCFATLAEAAGVADLWMFSAKRVHVDLETVTPSGRTWDESTWMWRDAEQPGGDRG